VVLAEACADLTDQQVAKLLDQVLAGAAAVTVTGLAQRVRRVALALDPGWAERRYRRAVRERRVIGYLNEDGTATVSGQRLDAAHAAAACARIDALAAAAKRAGAHASLDHLRVELFLGLLDGRFHGMAESAIITELLHQYPRPDHPANNENPANDNPANDDPANDDPANSGDCVTGHDVAESNSTEPDGAGPAGAGPVSACAVAAGGVQLRGVQVRVGLGTLLGRDEQPGELAGWGTVTAAVARRIVAGQLRSEWRYAIHDEAGRLLFDGLTRRRPRGVVSQTQAVGGIVELHVPDTLLADPDLAREHPGWAAVGRVRWSV
jgi:hypothetical protein